MAYPTSSVLLNDFKNIGNFHINSFHLKVYALPSRQYRYDYSLRYTVVPLTIQ